MSSFVNHLRGSAADKAVYVIEPDGTERQRLESMLARIFRQVKTFDSAESFLAQRGSIQQGCLITASVLPGMGALELIDRLKKEGMRISVIVLGQGSTMPLAVNVMRAGAADFIERPFADRKLRQVVRKAMT